MTLSVMEAVIDTLLAAKGKTITLKRVVARAERPRKPVLRVLDRLTREGYLRQIEDHPIDNGPCSPPLRNPTWEIVKPVTRPVRRPQRRTVRDRIWKAIRMKATRGIFTLPEIQAIAEATEDSVRLYLRMLVKGGYLQVVGKVKPGQVITYRLRKSKDCGPHRPKLVEPKGKGTALEPHQICPRTMREVANG